MFTRSAQAQTEPLRSIETVAVRLEGSAPRWRRRGRVRWRAAVALVLRESPRGIEMLVIRRAVRAGDRWSGDAALPGGKVDADDASIESTAMRETLEEVGLDLDTVGARRLGTLSDHPPASQGRWVNFAVTPVVFAIEGDPPLRLHPDEVAEARWVALEALRPVQSRMLWWWRPYKRVPLGVPFVLSRWRLEGLTIWGLTYGIIDEFLTRLGR